MKSIIFTPINSIPTIHYPCLMQSENTGTVVLFHKACCGTVVSVGPNEPKFNPHILGQYIENWGMSWFETFNQAVLLEN